MGKHFIFFFSLAEKQMVILGVQLNTSFAVHVGWQLHPCWEVSAWGFQVAMCFWNSWSWFSLYLEKHHDDGWCTAADGDRRVYGEGEQIRMIHCKFHKKLYNSPANTETEPPSICIAEGFARNTLCTGWEKQQHSIHLNRFDSLTLLTCFFLLKKITQESYLWDLTHFSFTVRELFRTSCLY